MTYVFPSSLWPPCCLKALNIVLNFYFLLWIYILLDVKIHAVLLLFFITFDVIFYFLTGKVDFLIFGSICHIRLELDKPSHRPKYQTPINLAQ